MARFVISMLWGAMSTVIVYAASAAIFPGFVSGLVLAVLLGLTLWGADSLRDDSSSVQRQHVLIRLGKWFMLYEGLPALVISVLATVGLFVLSSGLLTALAMCLPISLITLRDYVDLSWLAR